MNLSKWKTLAVCAPTVALASIGVMNVYAQTGVKADPMVQIDLNRAGVVEKIVGLWSKEIPAGQLDGMKRKLSSLRADQLLAANVSGSFDGVLEIVNSADRSARSPIQLDAAAMGGLSSETIEARHSAAQLQLKTPTASGEDRAKVLGSTTNDLVYTPISPCNLMDTRPGVSPVPPVVGPALAPGYAVRTVAVTGSCGVPAGAKAVVALLTAENIPSTGGVIFAGDAGGTGGAVVSWSAPSQYASGSAVVTLSTAGALQLQSAGATHVKVDIAGYFAAPFETRLDCKYTPEATVEVVPGSSDIVYSERCDASSLFGGSYDYVATAAECRFTDIIYGSILKSGTEIQTTGSGITASTGERAFCEGHRFGGYVSTTGVATAIGSNGTLAVRAKCCKIPGKPSGGFLVLQ